MPSAVVEAAPLAGMDSGGQILPAEQLSHGLPATL